MKAAEIYLGSKTNRYHTDPILNRVLQTNADHQWGVALIVFYLVKKPSVDLAKAAVLHDGAEHIVGDPPNPFSRRYPEFRREHKEIEEQELKALGVDYSLTDQEKVVLKVADSLEALAFVKLHQPDYIEHRDDWKSHLEGTLRLAESLGPYTLNRTLKFLKGIDPNVYKSGDD